jgi:hypothetical protein
LCVHMCQSALNCPVCYFNYWSLMQVNTKQFCS